MLAPLCDIRRADVNHGAANSLGTGDYDVVVLGDLEGVQGFTRGGLVEHTDVNCVRDGVVDEFTENEAILALIKELHG